MKLATPLALALLTSALTLPACDKKVQECNKVADIANAAVTEMHKMEADMHGDAHDPVALAKDAEKFIALAEKASKDITAVEIKTEGLQPHVAAYTGMLDAAAGATKELLGELEKAGPLSEEKLAASQKALEDAQAGLGKACEGGAADCEKIGKVMDEMPDAPKDDEVGKMLVEHSAKMKALVLEDAGVKQASDTYVKVVDEYVELIAMAQRLDASVAKIDAAVEKEDEFCSGS
jgi:hypothetical protein